MANKPKRGRPAKSTSVATITPDTEATSTEVKPKRQYNRRTPVTHQLSVYYEDPEGTLQPMGEFKAAKAEEALQGYFAALEPDEFVAAIEASTYAVDSPTGLVRFSAGQKIEITPR